MSPEFDRRVLVIDDSPLVRGALLQKLEELGFLALAAADGQEGLSALGHFHPDVVLCDLDMPGMTGLEVVAAARERAPTTPVLILTVADASEFAVKAMREGAFGYLVKGVDDAVLRHELGSAIRHRQLLEHNRRLEEDNRRYRRDLERMVEEKTRELIKLRDRKAHAEKLSALATFVAGAAHELNNPLAAIISNLGWLEQVLGQGGAPDAATASEIRQALEETTQCAGRIGRIVEALQRYAHPAAASEECEVGMAIEELKILCRERVPANVSLSIEVDGAARNLEVGFPDLVLVLTNLVTNSVHAVESRPSPRISVKAWREGEWAKVEVVDNGCGIPREILSRVCDPFFTTKRPGHGTGMGLSLAQQASQAAGGELSIESELGVGTTVTISLPAEEEVAAAAIGSEMELRAGAPLC
ncbi:MAG: response regulator [Myxococcales bacterium]|nr:response regulator [Myxococcales bacterium]